MSAPHSVSEIESQALERQFNSAGAARKHTLDPLVMENFIPGDILGFWGNTYHEELHSSAGEKAVYDIAVDRKNGLYKGVILVTDTKGSQTYNEMTAHRQPSGGWQVDRLVVDGTAYNFKNAHDTAIGLTAFEAYKNAAFPNGEGPRVIFPKSPAEAAPDQRRSAVVRNNPSVV
jgi:hypothetical protein